MPSMWQRVQAYCAAMLTSRAMHGPARGRLLNGTPSQRRREERVPQAEHCEYAMTHALGPHDVVFEEGAGMMTNMSRSGMQLLLGAAPRRGQLLEVHLEGPALSRSVTLVEVRWTKSVRHDPQGQLHVVGCRLAFGPSRYWAS